MSGSPPSARGVRPRWRSIGLGSVFGALCLLTLGCDPGAGKSGSAASETSGTGTGEIAGTGTGEIAGEWDYSAVVSLDRPDGPPAVETYAVRTEKQLKNVRASVKDPRALDALQLDFEQELLLVVVAPGEVAPGFVEVSAAGEGLRVRYRAQGGAKPGTRGRWIARKHAAVKGEVVFAE